MQQRDTITFNGITFVRYPESKSLSARRYYYPFAKGRRMRGVGALHQELWKAAHGPIPAGHEIHHKDENPLNNDLDNLECLTAREHALRHHLGRCTPAKAANLDRIRPLASAWHRSEAGRAWHREHGRDAYKKRQPKGRTCVECGKEYGSLARRDSDRFCGTACAQRWYYKQKTMFTEETCPQCGKKFLAQPGRPDTCCSRSCAAKRRWARERAAA